MTFFCISGNAQRKSHEVEVMITPNHSDWKYKIGERCKFIVRIYEAMYPLNNVTIDYRMGPVDFENIQEENVQLKNGQIELTGTLSKPGYYRLIVTAHVNGRTYRNLCSVGYEPEKIGAVTTMPTDFREYWENQIAEARKTPLKAKERLLQERCTDIVNVYEVSFQNIREGSRTYGILCIPKNKGKYPTLVRFPGAGVGSREGDVTTAEKGAITLEIGIHGISVTLDSEVYNSLKNGELFEYYKLRDKVSRDSYFYHRVFLSVIRALDYIKNRQEYNGTLGVTGSSQGGALSLFAAAFDKDVDFLAICCPAMCESEAILTKDVPSGFHFFTGKGFKMDNDFVDPLRYYDSTNSARLITQPVWYCFGFNDERIGPHSLMAVYNALNTNKKLRLFPELGHYFYNEEIEERDQWLWEKLGIK